MTGAAERWAAVPDVPFDRHGRRRWTPDAARRVDRPETVEEKVRAVTDLTRDGEVAGRVAADLLRWPEPADQLS
ncbi:DUF6192 family protein, partial [Streptomyces sp. GSL17-113]|uniref:DUF6192 family protein n=1 Tax=Streptomyces sp. GSL17-113 TaxID=3115365 RepID=UPI002E78CE8A